MPLLKSVLQRFSTNSTFVETGTFKGDGVQAAIDAGFFRILSVELNQELYAAAVERFKDAKVHVVITQGSSPNVLPTILANVLKPATFWLDAHSNDSDDTSFDPSLPKYPICEELTAIAATPLAAKHTYLIDDFRLLDMATIQKALAILSAINRNFRVELVEGVIPFDVISAYPP